MSETTKQNAIDKLDNFSLNVAFPDEWHLDCIPALSDCATMVDAPAGGLQCPSTDQVDRYK